MKMSFRSRKIITVFIGCLILILTIIFSVANYALNVACLPDNPRRNNLEMCMEEVYEKYPDMRQWHDSLCQQGFWRDTFIIASDGLKRHAYILNHPEPTGSTVFIHGYCDNSARMMRYYYMHYEKFHRNCLVPDLYGHGLSEGKDVRFGWLDRLDVANIWLPMAHNLWPDLHLLQHGLSMGAATTMMTSGEELSDSLNLIGFIEDCGYNSTYQQLSEKIVTEVGLPAFPFLTAADLLCKWRFGWSMTESSAEKQLAKCKRPMLFIHGDADSYVPFYMLKINYDAKTQGYKEMWIGKGSEHAESIHDHWDEYVAHCASFIQTADSISSNE